MGRLFPLTTTPGISDAGRRWLAGERWEVARPRRASTVMLVRDAQAVAGDGAGVDDAAGVGGGGGAAAEAARGSSVEVFMLRRVSQMAFAPSTMVFPGGGVDERDGELGLPWAGPSPVQWGARLGCSPTDAQMYVAAAIREVFEECGVLLAGPSASGPLARVEAERWRGVRDALIARDVSLGEVLRDEGLVLRSDLVVAKAHWVTPVFEPRRFDTWFFAAHMPRGQIADGDTSEADHAAWVTPRELLSAYAGGQASMLPPTVMWVEEILQASSASEFVAHAEHLPLIMPEVVHSELGPAMEVVER